VSGYFPITQMFGSFYPLPRRDRYLMCIGEPWSPAGRIDERFGEERGPRQSSLVAELGRQNLSVDRRGFPKAIRLADLASLTLRRYWNA
jgi:hypothetical protein